MIILLRCINCLNRLASNEMQWNASEWIVDGIWAVVTTVEW